jgi:GntR family transcriptional regulator/MocR family aminotransferase
LSDYASRALALLPHARLQTTSARRLDLDYGRPLVLPAMQSAWRRALLRAADDTAFEYPPVAGLLRLRTALAGYLLRRRGLLVDPEDLLIINGTQQGIELSARLLLDPGQRALVEDPCYQGLRQSLLAQGAEVAGIAVDADGLVVADLQQQHVRLLAVTPSHQFPSGAVCALARRSEILQWAERADAYIIEDDYDGDFRHGGRPLAALKSLDRGGRVIYLGSLSKVLFPALRLGFLLLPRALREAFHAAKWLADRGCAAIEQQALSDLIESGQFERLLLRSSRHLDERRRALLDAIAEHLGNRVRVVGEQAGMHVCVWVSGTPSSGEAALIERAAALDLGLWGINRYYQTPPVELGLLIGYGHLSPGELEEAIRRLARAMG